MNGPTTRERVFFTMATLSFITPEFHPAADTGLPSNIIAYPISPPPAEYEPDRQQFEAAFVALCL